ncbi:MAG: hypothetical protein M5U26_15205 [Planctomycetota bacterium]|nr:hypothetical protein [Planctomycetota bacterium]
MLRFRSFTGALAALGVLLFSGCGKMRNPLRAEAPPPPPEYAAVPPHEAAKLSEADYLKRKATVGTRLERLEALDVIDRTSDPEMIPFLIERLEKEDDPFLQIRVMHALSKAQDVRAVLPLRRLAMWNDTKLGIEAIVTLFELGDDNFVPRLIRMMRKKEENPELATLAHRTLRRIYKVEIAFNDRAWNNYFRSHRLAPYQDLSWYASFRPPPPPTVAGTTKVEPRPEGGTRLPQQDAMVRRHILSAYEFWRPDEP